MTVPVLLTVDVCGYYYNHWPFLKILCNNKLIFDDNIIEHQQLNFNLECDEQNTLEFVHYGKSFGENNIWDSNHDASEQCFIEVKDIKFDHVSIDNQLKSKLVFKTHWTDLQITQNSEEFISQYSQIFSNGSMNFNGSFILDFETPVYRWLTLSKYKQSMQELAYFSNHTARWHYEEDLRIIDEIKGLMNFDKNTSS